MKRFVGRRILKKIATLAPMPVLFLMCVTRLASAATPESSSISAVQAPAMFWVTVIIVTIFIAVLMLSVLRGLIGSQQWTLVDALSEEADPQPSPLQPGQKPVMVASASRLIAFLGLVVILSLFLGVGYYLLWCLFTGRSTSHLSDITSYFYSGIVLFAPYIINKFSDAFSIFKPPTTK
jgi:hypothetical protein